MKGFNSVLMIVTVLTLAACGKKEDQASKTRTQYTCSMHPQIVLDQPGKCPICGMELVPLNSSSSTDGSIMLSESRIKLGNITTTLSRYEDFGSTTILNGKLTVNEELTQVISSRTKGRIERLYFKESGRRVEHGQALYEIYSEELLTLQQEYLIALKQYEELRNEKRYESFLKASEKKLLLLGMTTTQVQLLAKRKTSEPKILFLSPVSGVITRIDATEGQYVEEGAPLYRIDKLDPLWVEAEIYTNEEHLAKSGDSVKVVVSGFENSPVDGRITFLSPEYRNGSQILTLRAVIDNSHHQFLPGLQATVLLVNSRKRAIALPVDAVIRSAKGNHVWIRTEEGAFKPRMVVTGMENPYTVEIIHGLEEKENVVITGAYALYGELVLKKGGDPMAGHHH
ncbi:MAG TPA: efflux RND transporter periplasmic adaptor subunit [Cyclobacteriaceae bacterium]|nr:efflux RND transporter periplasmic adaptor subunit [Cyclobacteriaceae bacterium]